MKLQNLIIIFIIIIIPIVLIFSLYLNLETQTILRQNDYDEKLIEATKEAMEAFEVNTVEWSNGYSTLANSKRQDILSSINVFTTGLSDKLRIGGTSKESILTYVPAMVYIMYDGYYIYSPTYVPQTINTNTGIQLFYYKDGSEGTKITASATQNINGKIIAGEPIYERESGPVISAKYNGTQISFTTNTENAKKVYKHILKTFVPYTYNYKQNGKEYTINYTLDNYVRIYEKDEFREGYIIEEFQNSSNKESVLSIPKNSVIAIFNGKTIEPEGLFENIAIRNNASEQISIKSYEYIYNSNNDKRYYEPSNGKFFTISNNYTKVYLPDTEVGSSIAEYKKILIRPDENSHEYMELFQLINGNDNKLYFVDSNNKYIASTYNLGVSKDKDCSAVNYYIENYDFNCWLSESGFNVGEILDSKKQSIIDNINNNLNLSISNYSANSNIKFSLPELTDTDWEQALTNVSLITFFQGAKIGLKTYNNYVVVTSTENNEYISEDSLYYIGDHDEYYHRFGCNSSGQLYEAYRNTEFKVQNYQDDIDDKVKYYYKHMYLGSETAKLQCFDCIVNRNNMDYEEGNEILDLFYTALARERYVQMSRTRLTDSNGVIINGVTDLTPTNTEITWTPDGWTSGHVNVTINTSEDTTGSELQYSINDTNSWNKYDGPFTVSNNNTTIRARLWNGVNAGNYVSATVENIDKRAPVVSIIQGSLTGTELLQVNVLGDDADETQDSGKSGIATYDYYIGSTFVTRSSNNTYTYTGLQPNTTYELRVIVKDYAGNQTEVSINATTIGRFVIEPDPPSEPTLDVDIIDAQRQELEGTYRYIYTIRINNGTAPYTIEVYNSNTSTGRPANTYTTSNNEYAFRKNGTGGCVRITDSEGKWCEVQLNGGSAY